MKNLTKIALLTPVVLAIMTGCSGNADKKASANQEVERVQPVQTIPLAVKSVATTLEFTSSLSAFEEVNLAPASPGRIETIYPEVSDYVKAGQLVVMMDPTNLNTTQYQFNNLQIEMNRMEALRQAGSISQQAYDQTKLQYDLTKANLDFLRKNTEIRAPFSGIISGRYFEDKELFSGSPSQQTGKAAILTLVKIDLLKAKVAIPESYFPLVKVGMPVQVTSDIYPNQTFSASILRIYPTIDASTRTFQVEVKVQNGASKLRPGMFARTTIDLGKMNAMLVPYQAVLKLQGSNDRYIFLNENGVAKRVDVKLGKRYDDQVEIISDQLKENDEVVALGQARLVNGAKLKVTK